MATKRVLACVVQWDDGEGSRLNIVGWSDCSHQRAQMRKAALESIDLAWVEAIRFVEIDIPLVETTFTADAVMVEEVA